MTDDWGVVDGYHDAQGKWHETTAEVRRTLHEAMGDDPASVEARAARGLWVVRAGEAAPLLGPVDLALEGGGSVHAEGRLPPDLPLGYHELRPCDGARPALLIVAPARCYFPEQLYTWGWALQLYALRSRHSWGMGDLADLRRFGRWARRRLGAGLLLLNPLNAAAPVVPQEPSPYYPTSRRFRNPLYLAVEEVPGAADAGLDLDALVRAGRALGRTARIDRDAVFRAKHDALGRIWERFPGDAGFDAFRAAGGRALEQFAAYCVLAERFGRNWRDWDPRYRHPDAAGVAELTRTEARRVGYHVWLQWLLDRQLESAGVEIPLMQDLPIGVDSAGADAWCWQDVLASRTSVGAPPDEFNTQGQDWGLPPFVPHKLRAAGYGPFIETIRAAMSHGRGLRIDHVMGLFRLFWIPWGAGPKGGTYVRYRADELLAILALESQRAGALVVGEDLGTVEAGVREQLAAHRVLSYRLLWFENQPPTSYPELAMAAVTTHDLPTIAGLWDGSDILAQRAAGLDPNEGSTDELRTKVRDLVEAGADTPVVQVIERLHERLAEAPSRIVVATLEDAVANPERPNMPGTINQWPNWRLPLPVRLEALGERPLVHAIAAAFARRDRHLG